MQEINIYDEDNNIVVYVTQWDTNVEIRIKDSDVDGYELDSVNFFNVKSNRALVTEVTHVTEGEGSPYYSTHIPNIILQQPYPIIGYAVVETTVGFEQVERALFRFMITVRKQPQPSDRIYIDDGGDDYIDAVEILEEVRQYAEDAEIYCNRAEQAAGQSGYMYFYINEDGDLMLDRTENVDVDFMLIDGDLVIIT